MIFLYKNKHALKSKDIFQYIFNKNIYYKNDIPFTDDYYLSISHKHDMVMFGLYRDKIGVDIEYIDKNFKYELFLNWIKNISFRKNISLEFDLQYTIIIWSCFEAVFKTLSHKNIKHEDIFFVKIIKNYVFFYIKSKLYIVNYFLYRDYVISYSVDKNTKHNIGV